MSETGNPVPTHPFDEAVALTPRGGDRFAGHTHPAYGNMVGPFGGITAAILLRAAQQHPDRLGDPLALTVNFAGPVADGPFEVTATPLRTNRSTQHFSLTLTQDGTVTTTGTAVFGTGRATWTDTEAVAPDVKAPEDVPVRPSPGHVAFTDNYEIRFVEGAMPDGETAGQADSTTTLWMRDRPARPLDHAALAALADVFYPRVLLRTGRFVPAGTVSLTTYFHADAVRLAAQGDEPVLGSARAGGFGNGFFDQSARLWARDGALLATSHQWVYFKD